MSIEEQWREGYKFVRLSGIDMLWCTTCNLLNPSDPESHWLAHQASGDQVPLDGRGD